MTIEEFYEEIGESYEQIFERFGSKERVQKYALMFAKDDTFSGLVNTMENKDYETAFRMVHTLKGVSANLCFNSLYNASVILTDILRAKKYTDEIDEPYKKVKEEYQKIMSALDKFQGK